jgi:hypothetical protein
MIPNNFFDRSLQKITVKEIISQININDMGHSTKINTFANRKNLELHGKKFKWRDVLSGTS